MKRTVTLLLFVLLAIMAKSQQWKIQYYGEEGFRYILTAGDNSGDYEYFVGNRHDDKSGDVKGFALCAYENGCYIDRCFGQDGRKTWLNMVFGLDDGNAFVAGMCSDNDTADMYDKLWVAILNNELEIVKENYINIEYPYLKYLNTAHILRNNNNEIVLLSRVADDHSDQSGFSNDYVFYLFDDECNMLKCSYLRNDAPKNDVTDFTLIPNTNNYAIFGNGIEGAGAMNVVYVDEDFNVISVEFFDDTDDYPNLMLPIRMTVDHWYDENHFMMSAQNNKTTGINEWRPFVVKMDTDMNVLEFLDFERVDTTDYVFQDKSMSYINPDKIYVATMWARLYMPNEIIIYLINDRLEVLGRKSVYMDDYYLGIHSHSSSDESCIVQGVMITENVDVPLIYKFDSEEFEITIDVVETQCCQDLAFYPNPVSSLLNINLKEVMHKKARVSIVDMMGRRCLDRDVFLDGNMLSLDVLPLESGTYLYKIIVDNKCIYKDKFIKD